MTNATGTATIKVTVGYAGGRAGPYLADLPPQTTLATVRASAMDHFQVKDGSEGGNQIVYTLVHGDDPVRDLTRTIADESKNERTLNLRLVREVIAG